MVEISTVLTPVWSFLYSSGTKHVFCVTWLQGILSIKSLGLIQFGMDVFEGLPTLRVLGPYHVILKFPV